MATKKNKILNWRSFLIVAIVLNFGVSFYLYLKKVEFKSQFTPAAELKTEPNTQ